MMQTAITKDVKITVETAYQNNTHPNYSGEHMFAYRITDSVHGTTEVEGEGVVGQQPVLEPGETHQYVSGCAIKSDIGKMHGTYLMERSIDGQFFEVKIPEFLLVAPFYNN